MNILRPLLERSGAPRVIVISLRMPIMEADPVLVDKLLHKTEKTVLEYAPSSLEKYGVKYNQQIRNKMRSK